MDLEEIENIEDVKIDTKCVFCGHEIQEDEEIILGNEDNLDFFDPSNSNFKMAHVQCMKDERDKE